MRPDGCTLYLPDPSLCVTLKVIRTGVGLGLGLRLVAVVRAYNFGGCCRFAERADM